eukprot:TRINITY_DN55598_c0_g1_i1.p1 TRINITY_DN55598_c0_g1~~TRINITY_DN55598_c0_g1_i1.p1  ORF type:complete len:413 (+),score=52.54 TRINITY_DN55598_c0_g1_i1:65-1240(+)
MVAVAVTVRLLNRYADLLAVTTLLPLLSHSKFARLTRSREPSRAAGSPATGATETTVSTCIPPTAALFLFLAAEMCTFVNLFDPNEMHLRKAVSALMRVTKLSDDAGFAKVLEATEKALENDDFFLVFRFMVVFAAIASLTVNKVLRLDKLDEEQTARGHSGDSLLMLATGSIRHVVSAFFDPKLWFTVVLLIAGIMGNWSALGRLLRRPGMLELVRSFAPAFRTAGVTLTVMQLSCSGPLPLWASAHGAGAAARAGAFFLFERLSVQSLLDFTSASDIFFSGTVATRAARGTLLMEAFCFLAVLPWALSRRGVRRLTMPILLMPVALLLSDRVDSKRMQPLIEQGASRLTIACAGCGAVVTFLGGVFTLVVYFILISAFNKIHKLDRLRF